jgi:hypothetical protein
LEINLNNPKGASFKENHLMTMACDSLRTTSIFRFRNYLFGSFEIISIRLYTPLHSVYNLIEVISNEPNKNCDQSLIKLHICRIVGKLYNNIFKMYLCSSTTWTYSQLYHGENNHYLLLLLNVANLAVNQHTPIVESLVWPERN